MPEQFRALVVVLFLASSVFYILRRPANEIIGTRSFNLRRNLWFGVTLITFLSFNYWLFVFFTWLLLIFFARREKNKIALFIFLLFAVPYGGNEIPGFGIVNYLFLLKHPRFLALCILLPVFLNLWRNGKLFGSKNNALDKLVISYLFLIALLAFRGASFTDNLRGLLYLFTDICLPYFVISRSLSSMDDFKDALFSYVAVILLLSGLGVFELLKYWHLYAGVEDTLGLTTSTAYQEREGYLRAHASLERIPLGFVIAIGLGFHLFFLDLYSRKGIHYLVTGAIFAGLISPLSRGPWVGAVVLVSVYLFFSPNKLRRLTLLALAFGVFAVVISFTPMGGTLAGLFPTLGQLESGNFTYRQQVITNSLIVIMRNPLLGSVDYLSAPEMEALRQGEGIIDIVNTYVSVTLKIGLVGLMLFAGIFSTACLKVFICFTKSTKIDNAEKNLGKILLATLLCIMVMLFTVSFVSAIPITTWIVLAMCSAYTRMIENKMADLTWNRGVTQ